VLQLDSKLPVLHLDRKGKKKRQGGKGVRTEKTKRGKKKKGGEKSDDVKGYRNQVLTKRRGGGGEESRK